MWRAFNDHVCSYMKIDISGDLISTEGEVPKEVEKFNTLFNYDCYINQITECYGYLNSGDSNNKSFKIRL